MAADPTGTELALTPAGGVESAIRIIRDRRVVLDSDLAAIYGVDRQTLLRAVRRNPERFPDDFMFQLTREELQELKAAGALPRDRRRSLPYAFTEQGVAMLSSVLRSPRAVQVDIEIMRAFVRLRRMLASNHELAHRVDALEQRYDAQFRVVFEAIRQLMAPPPQPKGRLGFPAPPPDDD